MILAILTVSAIGYFFYAVLGRRRAYRRMGMWTAGTLIVLSVLAIAANDALHFGLKPVTTTTSTALVAAKQDEVLLKTPIGTNGKDAVYFYRTDPSHQTVLSSTPSLKRHNRVIRGQKPQVRIATTRYRYQNRLCALLFSGAGQDGLLVKRVVTFVLPPDWHVRTLQQHK